MGFDLIPLGSGIVVVVVDEVELAASSTMREAIDPPEVGVKAAVLVLSVVVVVVATLGFKVSPVPVWTVTNAPGVTSEGL